MHVVQAERICQASAHGLQFAVGVVASPLDFGHLAGVVSGPIPRRGSCPTSILPFCFRRQSITEGSLARHHNVDPILINRIESPLSTEMVGESGRGIPTGARRNLGVGIRLVGRTARGRLRIEAGKLFATDFAGAEIERLCQNDFMPRRFTPDRLDPVGRAVFQAMPLDDQVCFLDRAPHRKLAWRNKPELHAEGVRVLDRHLQIRSPFFLMPFRLLSIERCDGGSRRIGRPTLPGLR